MIGIGGKGRPIGVVDRGYRSWSRPVPSPVGERDASLTRCRLRPASALSIDVALNRPSEPGDRQPPRLR